MAEAICEASGKIQYPTQSKASKARREFRRKFKRPNSEGELMAFKCNVCGQWHLGRRHYNRKRRWST